MRTHAPWSQGLGHDAAGPSLTGGRAWRMALLLAPALAGLIWAASPPPWPQGEGYHHFADTRTVAGLPNGLNVLSNAAFAAAGLAGLLALRRRAFAASLDRWPWATFFVAVGLTSLGSAWYHLAPSTDRLVWDRLPMAAGFMSLLAALVGERIDRRAGLALLGPLVVVGLASVISWHLGERAGHGNLKPYYLVQSYPLLAVPLLLALFPDRRASPWPIAVALLLYLAAKGAELEDRAVLDALGVVSGHTLKHLLAAAGVGVLACTPRRTQAAPSASPGPAPGRWSRPAGAGRATGAP